MGEVAPPSPLVSAVAKLVYSTIMSLDGYTTDASGNIAWGAPDDEVFTCINELERGIGTHLYGRKMYETMVYWETFDAPVGQSSTERAFDPGAVLRIKETTGHDISVGGPDLAGQAIAAGLVDEMHLFLNPVTVGSGTVTLPDHFDITPELLGVDRFMSGVVHLHYHLGR